MGDGGRANLTDLCKLLGERNRAEEVLGYSTLALRVPTKPHTATKNLAGTSPWYCPRVQKDQTHQTSWNQSPQAAAFYGMRHAFPERRHESNGRIIARVVVKGKKEGNNTQVGEVRCANAVLCIRNR